jgi:uncharacterized protein YecT (DUF1311 family)
MSCKKFMLFSLLCYSINAFSLDCSNLPGGVGPDAAQASLQCAEHDRAVADQSLNDRYRKLLAQLKGSSEPQSSLRNQLVSAQRAWIAFRDTECEFRTNLSGGAPQWLMVNRTQCLTELTTARVKVLDDYLEDAR